MNAIDKELGVSGPALYRYFAGRDDLLKELVIDAHIDLAAALQEAGDGTTNRAPRRRFEARPASSTGSAAVSSHGCNASTRYRDDVALTFNAVYEDAGKGWVYVHVPELPEVHTQGEGLEQARAMVREAIELVLEDRRERGEPIPETGWALVEPVEIAA